MRYRTLGSTEIEVSTLCMGTVSLGLDYGIEAPDGFGKPTHTQALNLLHAAADEGITFYDTAPTYGDAEERLGAALGARPECLFATKVTLPRGADADTQRCTVRDSVHASLRSLRRDCLDLVQIHNATCEDLQSGAAQEELENLRAAGKIRLLGTSVYTEAEALATIERHFDFVQAAFNMLDQRLSARVLPLAQERGVAFGARSALLKGVLSAKAQWLPPELKPLQQAAQRICTDAGIAWDDLPQWALRYCLSEPRVSTVLIGARTGLELQQAVAAVEAGPLSAETFSASRQFAVQDAQLLNPANWPVA